MSPKLEWHIHKSHKKRSACCRTTWASGTIPQSVGGLFDFFSLFCFYSSSLLLSSSRLELFAIRSQIERCQFARICLSKIDVLIRTFALFPFWICAATGLFVSTTPVECSSSSRHDWYVFCIAFNREAGKHTLSVRFWRVLHEWKSFRRQQHSNNNSHSPRPQKQFHSRDFLGCAPPPLLKKAPSDSYNPAHCRAQNSLQIYDSNFWE